MRRRVFKFCTVVANAVLIWLLVRLLTGHLDMGLAFGFALISGFWLFMTYADLGRLLHTYARLVSRLQVCIPLIAGLVLSSAAVAVGRWSLVSLVAAAEICCWLLVYRQYRKNKQQYEKQKHGPLPKGVKINPKTSLLTPGTFVLTAGDIFAPRMHDAVDHAELVLRNPETGEMECFSSWISYGAVCNPLRRIVIGVRRKKSFYIALVPVTPLTDEENGVLYEICQAMLKENEENKACWNRRIERVVGRVCRLPMPKSWKTWLQAHGKWDGYDYLGIANGRRRKHAWTCIGACLEAWYRFCKEMERRGRPRPYLRNRGIGFAGIGTGVADPLVVCDLLDEAELHLITVADQPEGDDGDSGDDRASERRARRARRDDAAKSDGAPARNAAGADNATAPAPESNQ